MDISNFYLMTPLLRPEYICIKLSDLLEEIILQYKLRDKVNKNGIVFVEVTKDMYGLPQSGLRVKYVGRELAEHLYKVLCNDHKVTTDWKGERYIGIHLRWDYVKHQVHLFMPWYVKKALTIFQHKQRCQQNQPFPHTPIKYGARKQYAKSKSSAPLLDKNRRSAFKKCVANFFSLDALSTVLSLSLSALSPPNQHTPQRTPWNIPDNSWITSPLKKKTSLRISAVT
jgi:hypothetical protein